MKRFLLALALLLLPTTAWAQCNGVFPNNTACGNISGSSNIPRPVPLSSFPTVAGGTNGQIQYNSSGALAGFTAIGDCTITPSTGQVTCTKTNGVAYGPLATLPGNPTNLYVSKTGNDSNNCLSPGTSCLTVQHAVNVAQTGFSYQGANITINIGAGTYAEQVTINGPMGLGGINPPALILKGAGSGTTSIDPSTNCGGGVIAVKVVSYALVGIGSIKLGSTCSGGRGLFITAFSKAFPSDGDLNFGAATSSLVDVIDGSSFDANFAGAQPLTISGASAIGFLISTQSRVVTGVGVTNVITGTPAIGVFVDAIDGSFFNWGATSTWSGSATGTRYALALNSYIDTEQITTPLPGNAPGLLSNGSYYYTNAAITCVGGSGGCRDATAPTGAGSGATFPILNGSGDQAGTVGIAAGTGASTTGTIRIATASLMEGPLGAAGHCTVSLDSSNSLWSASASVQSFYNSGGVLQINWANGASALTNGGVYYISWTCQ